MKPNFSRPSTLHIAVALVAMMVHASAEQTATLDEAPTIAIAPMRGDSSEAALFNNASCGQELAHIFITELGKLKIFRVLENLALQDLKDEMQLGDDGWIEPTDKTEKSHFKGADFIFLARVTRFGSKEKEFGGDGTVPIRPRIPGLGPFDLKRFGIKKSEHEVQLDWRIIDASTRVAVKTGCGIGIETGTEFDFGSTHGTGFMREKGFQLSGLGKATMKAVASVIADLREFQPPMPGRTKVEKEKVALETAQKADKFAQLRSSPGQVLYAKGTKLIVSLGTKHGFKKGDKLDLFMVEETKDDDGIVVFTKNLPVGEVEIVDAAADRSEASYQGTTPARKGWIVMHASAN